MRLHEWIHHHAGRSPARVAIRFPGRDLDYAALAQLVDKLPNLKFRGMLAYDGGAQHIKGYRARHDQSLARSEDALKTFERMNASGLNAEIFSGGGTGTYNIMQPEISARLRDRVE